MQKFHKSSNDFLDKSRACYKAEFFSMHYRLFGTLLSQGTPT